MESWSTPSKMKMMNKRVLKRKLQRKLRQYRNRLDLKEEKSAKFKKKKADSHECSSALDESAASLATSSLKLSETYERSQKMKAEIAVRQIAVEEAKAQVEEMKAQVDICKMLLDPTEGEKTNVRKKLLACLKLEADPEEE
jgi:hypothetical protein